MNDRDTLRIDKANGTEVELLAQLNRQLDADEPHPYPLPLSALSERMARWIGSREYEVLLFRRGDRVTGYAVWRVEDRGAYLRHFFICRDQRRQGWGRAAIQLPRRKVFPKDLPVQIEAAIGNKAGIAFWRALGFEEFGVSMELKAGAVPK